MARLFLSEYLWIFSMSRSLNLLCLFGIFAIFFVDHAGARLARRLEGEGIKGGTYAGEGQFPYQISLELDGDSICGGSILAERFAVTAAHCVTDHDGSFMNRPLKVVAGISNLESRSGGRVTVNVAKVYVPREYDPTILQHGVDPTGDIAILELSKDLDIEANTKLGRVKLPENNETNYEGKNAIISGFGLNEVYLIFNGDTQEYDEIDGDRDNNLRFAEAKVIGYDDCQSRYDVLRLTKVKHLCAGIVQRNVYQHEGLCTGDSGAGLIYDGTIIGVVSSSPTGCHEDVKPAIYTRVSSYLGFINNVLNGEIDNNIRTTTLDIAS